MRTFRTFAIACAALASGCSATSTAEEPKPTWTHEDIRLDNVVRVLMHEPNHYSLLVRKPDSTELDVQTYRLHARELYDPYAEGGKNVVARCGIRLFTDAPAGEPMWATLGHWSFGGGRPLDCDLKIHLHDETNVEGGGWEHHRHRRPTQRGTTHVIE